MGFFQLRTLPGYAWPALPDAALARVWAAYLELDRTQWLAPAEIERRQLQQARLLLAHAITQVPYFRDLLPRAGIAPGAIQAMDDFRRIPILPRQTYQENVSALEAIALPHGTSASGKTKTAGSSGIVLEVLQTNMTDLWWAACYLRNLEWCGMDPTGSMASIFATGASGEALKQRLEGIFRPYWLAALEGLIETGPAHGMDIQQDHQRQLDWLRRIQPDYLLSHASNLEVLASLAEEQGQGVPGLRTIQSISESLTEDIRQRVERAFAAPVKNLYSCCEGGYLASPCPAGYGLHVHAENVLLEVVDEAGQPCGPGRTGRVLVTALHNFRSPFIRYELGDLVTLASGRCACGRGLPLLERVLGKSRPMFRLQGGRLKSSSGVTMILFNLGGTRQHQVVQKEVDHVVVRLMVDASWSDDHAVRLRRELQEFFETPIRVDIELKSRLELTPRGKLANMICELDRKSE